MTIDEFARSACKRHPLEHLALLGLASVSVYAGALLFAYSFRQSLPPEDLATQGNLVVYLLLFYLNPIALMFALPFAVPFLILSYCAVVSVTRQAVLKSWTFVNITVLVTLGATAGSVGIFAYLLAPLVIILFTAMTWPLFDRGRASIAA
jgi:hypothetical protein